MGHPNVAGAQAYANPIIDLLQAFPQWVGLGQLSVSAVPGSIKPNVLTDITVQVADFNTQKPVPDAVVHVGNRLVRAGETFRCVFTCSPPPSNPRAPRNAVTEPPDFPPPGFVVTAPGYLQSDVEFVVSGIKPGTRACRGI
jgi:hypothetical protein